VHGVWNFFPSFEEAAPGDREAGGPCEFGGGDVLDTWQDVVGPLRRADFAVGFPSASLFVAGAVRDTSLLAGFDTLAGVSSVGGRSGLGRYTRG